MNLTQKLKRLAAFNERTFLEFLVTTAQNSGDKPSLYDAARFAHQMNRPLIEALITVAEAGETAIAEIKAQRGLWPAEVDSLEDALTALEKLSGDGGSGAT